MANLKKPELKTLTELINYSSYYDIRKYSKSIDIDGAVTMVSDLFDTYFQLVEPYIQRAKTSVEHAKYNHNPRLLSKDLYDTPDLDWVLIKINRMSPSRFVMGEMINFIHKDDIDVIFDILSSKIEKV